MSVCLYSCLRGLGRKLHLFCAVVYRKLWPLHPYHVFPPYLINDIIFEGTLLKIKYVLRFSLHFFLEHYSFDEDLSDMLSSMYISLYVKYPLLLLLDFNET